MTSASRFVRHDLMCTDVPAGVRFYTELFGWKTTEVKVMGATVLRLTNGDQVLGAIIPFDKSFGYPSHWVPYVYVDSVEDCCTQVAALGGDVCVGVTQIPPGRFALVNDPQKAIFSPFTPKDGNPTDHVLPLPAGAFCWDELLTNDVAGAKRFYTALFGWGTIDKPGLVGPYTLFMRGDVPAGGLMQLPPSLPRPPAWLSYVAVDDPDATARRAMELGGTIAVPPMEIPEVGRFAVLIDSTSAGIAILKASC